MLTGYRGDYNAQLISVISLLSQDTPDTNSPANVDAAVRSRVAVCSVLASTCQPVTDTEYRDAQKEVREDIQTYRKKVRRLARRSAEEGFD